MKKTILSLLVAIGLIGSEKLLQGATVVITDQTINQSVTISNFYSNNVVIDFGRQVNLGDSISVSWLESNQQLISNSIISNSVTTNIWTTSGVASQGPYSPGEYYQWQGTSSLAPQNISQNTWGFSTLFPYSYNAIFSLTAPISKETPLVFNTVFDCFFRVVNVQSGRFLNPPNGYGYPGYGTIFTTTLNYTDTIWSQSVTIVPEPSTYALFGLGALALVVAYRRKVA